MTTVQKDRLATPAELAEYLGLTVSTLAQQRCRGEGVPFVRVGRTIRYRWETVYAYLDEGERTCTA